MYSSAIASLEQRVKILEETVRNLQQECQRLYQTGFSNGVEVAREEFKDEFKRLEDKGLISYHGFLKPEPKEAFDKWVEINYDKFERRNIITKKEQTLSDLYPTMHCATGSCGGCNELYLVDVKACSGDLFKYICKKKNITILSNTTPKPENFAKAFKEE